MAVGDRYGQSLLINFIASVALMTDVLTLNVNLDFLVIDDVTSPMIALMFFALILLVVLYPLVFVLVLPIFYLMNFRSKEIEKRSD
jgi:hypothetical protein